MVRTVVLQQEATNEIIILAGCYSVISIDQKSTQGFVRSSWQTGFEHILISDKATIDQVIVVSNDCFIDQFRDWKNNIVIETNTYFGDGTTGNDNRFRVKDLNLLKNMAFVKTLLY